MMRRGAVRERLGRLEYTVGSVTLEAITALLASAAEVLHSVLSRNLPDIELQIRVACSVADEARGPNKPQETRRSDLGLRKPAAQEVAMGIALARNGEAKLSALMDRISKWLSRALDTHVPDPDLRQRILAETERGIRDAAEGGIWSIRPKP